MQPGSDQHNQQQPRRRRGTELTTVRLLDAAAAEFIELGYDGARISSIARRAGLTPGAVYARWQNKNEMMAATLDHIFEKIQPGNILGELGSSSVQGMPAPEALLKLAAQLMQPGEWPHVMVQVFASTRNNAEMRDRLQAFLSKEASQLAELIESGKQDGSCDPSISTPALTFLFQSIGIGVELMIESGIDDRHTPTAEQWQDLMRRLAPAISTPDGARG
jgi:AcrR family transcriptional regulator